MFMFIAISIFGNDILAIKKLKNYKMKLLIFYKQQMVLVKLFWKKKAKITNFDRKIQTIPI